MIRPATLDDAPPIFQLLAHELGYRTLEERAFRSAFERVMAHAEIFTEVDRAVMRIDPLR